MIFEQLQSTSHAHHFLSTLLFLMHFWIEWLRHFYHCWLYIENSPECRLTSLHWTTTAPIFPVAWRVCISMNWIHTGAKFNLEFCLSVGMLFHTHFLTICITVHNIENLTQSWSAEHYQRHLTLDTKFILKFTEWVEVDIHALSFCRWLNWEINWLYPTTNWLSVIVWMAN